MKLIKRSDLIGAWKLVSYTERDVETGIEVFPMGEHPDGIIMYTPDGYMSAQLGIADRKCFGSGDPYAGTPQEYEAAGKTYIAYSGPFYLDEGRGLLEHEMFVSFFPNWRGQRQVRVAHIDDMLHLAPDQPMPFNGTMKLANLSWKRLEPNL